MKKTTKQKAWEWTKIFGKSFAALYASFYIGTQGAKLANKVYDIAGEIERINKIDYCERTQEEREKLGDLYVLSNGIAITYSLACGAGFYFLIRNNHNRLKKLDEIQNDKPKTRNTI